MAAGPGDRPGRRWCNVGTLDAPRGLQLERSDARGGEGAVPAHDSAGPLGAGEAPCFRLPAFIAVLVMCFFFAFLFGVYFSQGPVCDYDAGEAPVVVHLLFATFSPSLLRSLLPRICFAAPVCQCECEAGFAPGGSRYRVAASV